MAGGERKWPNVVSWSALRLYPLRHQRLFSDRRIDCRHQAWSRSLTTLLQGLSTAKWRAVEPSWRASRSTTGCAHGKGACSVVMLCSAKGMHSCLQGLRIPSTSFSHPACILSAEPQCLPRGLIIVMNPTHTHTHPLYSQRYKVCEYHLKVDCIMRNGVRSRFCQQCGRYQPLEDFDDTKRSCRVRLQVCAGSSAGGVAQHPLHRPGCGWGSRRFPCNISYAESRSFLPPSPFPAAQSASQETAQRGGGWAAAARPRRPFGTAGCAGHAGGLAARLQRPLTGKAGGVT